MAFLIDVLAPLRRRSAKKMISDRSIRAVQVLALAVALLGACGGLETPVGDITGRIVGASNGAYVYPLGRPDLKAPLRVQADGVGTYSLSGVPTTIPAIVLYDGSDRAELVPLHVSGGATNAIPDRYGAAALLPPAQEGLRMPLAGTVLAAAVPQGGATAWRPTFDLPETVHSGLVPSSGGVYSVWPLPAGRFDVGATLTGFVGAGTVVNVVSGATMTAPVALPVDGGLAQPGCASVSAAAPSQCENGLVCEPSDGRCYECTSADVSHCAGTACDTATHLCVAPAPAASTYCSPCTSNAGCATGMFCRISSGATTGYCTSSGCASDRDCPAGFDCNDSHVCSAPSGCDAWIQTMGAVCYSDDHCHDALQNGWCAGRSDDHPGICTAACTVDADCAIGNVTSFKCLLGPGGATPTRCVAQ